MGLLIISIAKRLDGALDVGAPTIQRLFAFGECVPSLEDGCNTENPPLVVVDHPTCNSPPNPTLPKPGNI